MTIGYEMAGGQNGSCSTQLPRQLEGKVSAHARSAADRAFHLQLDQAIHLDGVFHRQFFHQRLDETLTIIVLASASLSPRLIR